MGRAAFELICVLCQSLAPPPTTAQLLDAGWLAEQRVLILQASLDAPVVAEALDVRVRPTPTAVDPSLGEDWTLPGGRALRLNLTPTPERCAPLMALTF